MHQFLPMSNPIQVLGLVNAGTGDTQTFSEVTNAPQYDALQFIVLLGTITSTGVATLRAKGSNVSGTYGSGTIGCYTHPDSGVIVSAQGTTGDSGLILSIDLYRPSTYYSRGEVVRATANIQLLGAVAVQYQSKVQQVYTYSGAATHGTDGSGAYVSGIDITSNPNLSLV